MSHGVAASAMDDTYRTVICVMHALDTESRCEGGRGRKGAADSRITRNVWNVINFHVLEPAGAALKPTSAVLELTGAVLEPTDTGTDRRLWKGPF